jgi:predicted unusual protein kinase regulating ubiquinone biosynthesis (AarF/ABC1/UbiB family)
MSSNGHDPQVVATPYTNGHGKDDDKVRTTYRSSLQPTSAPSLPAAFRAQDMEEALPAASPLTQTPVGTTYRSSAPAAPRSLRMRLRFWRIFLYAVQLFGRLVFWQMFASNYFPKYVERTNLKRWQAYARSFKHFAIDTGGVMIKAGQFISTRVDILPPEVTDELAALRDEVPPVPTDKIRAILERELGDLGARYSEFADAPLAAASLGQVYKARLHNGDKVVVKVLRPGIEEICHTDLRALEAVSRVAMNFRFVSKRADAVALAREFGRVLLEELSYRHEAQNAARFAEMFKDDMGVYIPKIYTEHSTDNILTIEDVSTLKINDYAALEAAGISRSAVAKRLADTYFKQIFEERFFHADPHPGNLFIYPLPHENGTAARGERPFYLIFIDFGMTGELTQQIAGGLVSTLSAIVERNPRNLIESYKTLGFLMPNADTERIEEATRAVFDQVWGLNMSEMTNISYSAAAELGKEFNDLIFAMPFQVPQDFIYLGRTVSILSGMCTAIDPQFNPWSELQPFAQRLAVQTITSGSPNGAGSPLLQSLFSGNAGQALMTIGQQVITRALQPSSGAGSDIIARLERGDLRLQVDPSASYKAQLARIETQGKRTGRAVIFGSLLVAATLLYTNGDIVPAVMGYVLSAVAFVGAMVGE